MTTVAMPAERFTVDSPAPFEELLTHPRLRSFVERTLRRKKLEKATAEDILGKVFVALTERRGDGAPDTLRRMFGLTRVILHGKLVDHFKHASVERRVMVDRAKLPRRDESVETDVDDIAPLHETASANEEAAIEAKLAFVERQKRAGVLTDEDIEGMMAVECGAKTTEDVANERGMSPGALRTRFSRIRAKLRAAALRNPTLFVMVLLVLLTVAGVIVALARRAPPPPVPPQPSPAPTAPLGVAPSATPSGDVAPPALAPTYKPGGR